MNRFTLTFCRSSTGALVGWFAASIAFNVAALCHSRAEISILLLQSFGFAIYIGLVVAATWLVIIWPIDAAIREHSRWRSPGWAPVLGLSLAALIPVLLVAIEPHHFKLRHFADPYVLGTLAAGAGTGFGIATFERFRPRTSNLDTL